MIQSFKGMIPVVRPSAFVHPQATVIGHVTIGADCFVGAGAVLRDHHDLVERGRDHVRLLRGHPRRAHLRRRLLRHHRRAGQEGRHHLPWDGRRGL